MRKIDYLTTALQTSVTMDYFIDKNPLYEECKNTKELLLTLPFNLWEKTLRDYGYSDKFIQTEVKNKRGRFIALLERIAENANEYEWGDNFIELINDKTIFD